MRIGLALLLLVALCIATNLYLPGILRNSIGNHRLLDRPRRIPLPGQSESNSLSVEPVIYKSEVLGIGFTQPIDYRIVIGEQNAQDEKPTRQGIVVTTEDYTKPRLYLPVPVSIDPGFHPSAKTLDDYAHDYFTSGKRAVEIHDSQIVAVSGLSALRQIYSTGQWTGDGSVDSNGPFEAAREYRYVFDCGEGRFFIMRAWNSSEEERAALIDAVAQTFYCIGEPKGTD